MAKEFGVLPSVVARDLDTDPEETSLLCIPLLRYAEAYSVFATNDSARIKAMNSSWMQLVKDNDLYFAEKAMA